jgi:two-component sensor histidine kinase
VKIEGSSVLLPSSSAQLLALAIHELATNAVKYGALAQRSGQLAVRWEVDKEAAKPIAAVEWRETGVAMPEGGRKRRGYGSELIERALPFQLGAKTKLEFRPDGLCCEIIVPITSKESRDG